MARRRAGFDRRSAEIAEAKRIVPDEFVTNAAESGYYTVRRAAVYLDLTPEAVTYHQRAGHLPYTVSPTWPYSRLIQEDDLALFEMRHLAKEPRAKKYRQMQRATT